MHTGRQCVVDRQVQINEVIVDAVEAKLTSVTVEHRSVSSAEAWRSSRSTRCGCLCDDLSVDGHDATSSHGQAGCRYTATLEDLAGACASNVLDSQTSLEIVGKLVGVRVRA